MTTEIGAFGHKLNSAVTAPTSRLLLAVGGFLCQSYSSPEGASAGSSVSPSPWMHPPPLPSRHAHPRVTLHVPFLSFLQGFSAAAAGADVAAGEAAGSALLGSLDAGSAAVGAVTSGLDVSDPATGLVGGLELPQPARHATRSVVMSSRCFMPGMLHLLCAGNKGESQLYLQVLPMALAARS